MPQVVMAEGNRGSFFSFLKDYGPDGTVTKFSASRILACAAYAVALLHIVVLTFIAPENIKWGDIAAFLVAVAVPYLGNSVKNSFIANAFKVTR